MQEHMNQFQKTFITMAAEYTEHVRREIEAANKKGANKKNDEGTDIHLGPATGIRFGPAPVTLEDKVRTANLLMVTIEQMRRENGDRISFGELHVEAAKPESASMEDFVREFIKRIAEAFEPQRTCEKNCGGIAPTEGDFRETSVRDRAEDVVREHAEKKIRELGLAIRKLKLEPASFLYVDLWKAIQALYVQKNYMLVCALCREIHVSLCSGSAY